MGVFDRADEGSEEARAYRAELAQENARLAAKAAPAILTIVGIVFLWITVTAAAGYSHDSRLPDEPVVCGGQVMERGDTCWAIISSARGHRGEPLFELLARAGTQPDVPDVYEKAGLTRKPYPYDYDRRLAFQRQTRATSPVSAVIPGFVGIVTFTLAVGAMAVNTQRRPQAGAQIPAPASSSGDASSIDETADDDGPATSAFARFLWRGALFACAAGFLVLAARAGADADDASGPVRCNGRPMERQDTCLLIDHREIGTREDLVRAGEPLRALRAYTSSREVALGHPMTYERMEVVRAADRREHVTEAYGFSTVALLVLAGVALSFRALARPVGHGLRRVVVRLLDGRRTTDRRSLDRLLWGSGAPDSTKEDRSERE